MTIRRGNSIIAGNAADIPSQTGQSGKFLTTNGTTASWATVNVDTSDCVKLTGNQTVAGDKTFSGISTFTDYGVFWKTPFNIIVKSTSIEDGVNPSSSQYMGIEFRDKNDARVGWIGLLKKADGTQMFELQKQGSTSGFYTPTPPTGDNSNQIATTAYINTKFQVVSALPASPDPDTYYFIPES